MGDYLDDLVAREMTGHVKAAPVLQGMPPPRFTAILPYFPLQAISGNRMTYAAWPLIDGQLGTGSPVSLTSTHFTDAYAGYLSATNLGGPGTPQLVALAQDQSVARTNVTKASAANGGLCLTAQDNPSVNCGYVPGYSTQWETSPGLPTLSISVDVWRAKANTPWQPAKGQSGGQRLRASLIYSDFRIVVLTPTPVSGNTGWYSASLLRGMRDGVAEGVTFTRMSNFGDPSGFQRARAYVMVGRVQFRKQTGSSVPFSELIDKTSVPAAASSRRMRGGLRAGPRGGFRGTLTLPQGRLALSPGLVLPEGRVIDGPRLRGGPSLATSWDTGDLYTAQRNGFLVSVVIDAPLAAPHSS